jgi:Xaa-Pro aminopeptidase
LHQGIAEPLEAAMEKELVDLGLLKLSDIKKQPPEKPALKKYFMHGIGHPLGLDVHDITHTVEPIQPGWVLTVEPGIYLPEFGVRSEVNVLTRNGAAEVTGKIQNELVLI